MRWVCTSYTHVSNGAHADIGLAGMMSGPCSTALHSGLSCWPGRCSWLGHLVCFDTADKHAGLAHPVFGCLVGGDCGA